MAKPTERHDGADKVQAKKLAGKSHKESDKSADSASADSADTVFVSGVSLRFVSLDRVRSRFAATLYPDPPTRRAWIDALAASARDVPLLVAELERLRTRYADLVAACRAGLIARHDGDDEREAWRYIQEEMPPAPPGHPLHHPDHYEAHEPRYGSYASHADARYERRRARGGGRHD